MFSQLKRLANSAIPVVMYARGVCIRIFEAILPHATHHDDQAEMNAIQRQIISLEESERTLATRYGMVGNFDPVEVFNEAKRRAFAHHHHSFENLQELDRLNNLRMRLAELRVHVATALANVSVFRIYGTLYSLLPRREGMVEPSG
ncbi:hypothetical protein EDD85DRAFT_1021966 [Armillaria nabsnona]|nr:hypothetical protein EDD85DRAFT_1021966 [Armillaria nabsnona]